MLAGFAFAAPAPAPPAPTATPPAPATNSPAAPAPAPTPPADTDTGAAAPADPPTAPPTDAAAPEDPFAGCTVRTNFPMVSMDCPDGVSIQALPMIGSEAEAVKFGGSAAGVTSGVAVEIPAPGGPPLKAIRARRDPVELYLTAVAHGGGVSQYLSCFPAGGACDTYLPLLAFWGLPALDQKVAGWMPPQVPPELALTVPTGCYPVRTDGFEGFACGLDTLGILLSDAKEPLVQLLKGTIAQRTASAKTNGTDMKVDEVACKVGGKPAKCALFTRPPHTPFDPPNDVVAYTRRPDGTTAIVDCRWAGPATAVPEFCAQAVTFKAPKP